jgi:hypothetical protein
MNVFKINKMKYFFIFLVFLLFSCSYHLKQVRADKSINIPYVNGDFDGLLTKELIYQISSSGVFKYKQSNADYKLNINVDCITNDQIGFRYDRENDGKLKKFLMPTENRQKITATITIFSNEEDKVIWGPKTICADVDYDYVEQDDLKDLSFIDKEGQRTTVLAFSIGQMESINCAQEAALIPLYRSLCRKIVDVLIADLSN